MVAGELAVGLKVLAGGTVLCVELPTTVTALDVSVGPGVETVGTGLEAVVVAMTVVNLLEVVPEVVVKDSAGLVPEVVTGTGLVDTVGGDTVVLAVVSGEDGPKVVVIVLGLEIVGVVRIAVVVTGLPVSVTLVVLWGVGLEGVGPEVVGLVVDSISVTPEVVTGAELVDTDVVVFSIVVTMVDAVLSVGLVVGIGVGEEGTVVLAVVVGCSKTGRKHSILC